MSVTMKDVAKAAGVSRGTVDRVIHDRGAVKKEVAERIIKVAAEMGYEPNRAGRFLAARKQPMVIGYLLPSIGNMFFEDVLVGVRRAEAEFADFGVKVIIKEVKGYDTNVHIEAIKELLEQGCGALCLTTVDVPELRQYVNKLVDRGIAVIAVNTDLTDTKRLCYVGNDYVKGGNTAAGLLSRYHSGDLNILIVTGSKRIKGHNQRINGFCNTLKEQNVTYHLTDIIESMDDNEHAYNKTLAALKTHPEVNCVYITAAGVAGACNAIAKTGIKDKRDQMWVITFDDIETTKEFVRQGVVDFTITQEPVQQGYQAIRTMFFYLVDNKTGTYEDYLTDNIIKIAENI